MPLYVAPQAQVMATLSAVADERMQTAAGMYEIRRHVLDLDNAGTPMVLLLWAEKATGQSDSLLDRCGRRRRRSGRPHERVHA